MSDPFEMLSRLAPAVEDRALEPGEDPKADELLRRIVAMPRAVGGEDAEVLPFHRRGRRRKRALFAGVVVLGLVGAGTAAAVVLTRRPANPATLMCYSEAAVEPGVRVVLPIDPASTPEQQCSRAWTDGTLGSGGPPPLVVCISEHEATVVIPGGVETCGHLGLAAAAPPADSDQLDALVSLSVPDVLLDECVDLDEARDRIQGLFDELGAVDWTVRVEGEITLDRPCATTVIEAAQREVLVISF